MPGSPYSSQNPHPSETLKELGVVGKGKQLVEKGILGTHKEEAGSTKQVFGSKGNLIH